MTDSTDTPPGWTDPRPVSRVMLAPGPGVMVKPDPYCDRCGLVVAEWQIHLSWHQNLAHLLGMLGAADAGLLDYLGLDLPGPLAEQLAWATQQSEITVPDTDKPDDDGGAAVPAKPSPPSPPPVPPAERRPDPADVTT